MTDPRFRPNSWCVPSEDFGGRRFVTWKTDVGLSEDTLDQRHAAIMHHHVAVTMNAAILGRHGTAKAFAESCGMKPNRVRQLLRGDIVLRLEDVASVRRNLGVKMSEVEAFTVIDEAR